jgi:coenzyme PQQ precursor peptide PqqA
VITTGFFGVSYLSTTGLIGWPSEARVPEHFQLHLGDRGGARQAERPARRRSTQGSVRRHSRLTALGGDPNFRPARIRPREMAMKWKTPVIIEIAVGLEINAYACAEVK